MQLPRLPCCHHASHHAAICRGAVLARATQALLVAPHHPPIAPLPYPTTMNSIFTSIEFYITALAVAIAVIAFFGSDSDTSEATSDIYSPMVITPSATQSGELPTVTIHANDDGTIDVLRRGITLPGKCSVYIKADFIKDNITFTEHISPSHTGDITESTVCDLHFTTRPRLHKKYHLRYECAGGSLWGTIHFANYCGYTITGTLKP